MEQQEQVTNLHPATLAVLEHFSYEHLPPHLQAVSAPIGLMASKMANSFPNDPEATVGLRKLLEAKDCFVRAAVRQHGRRCNNDRPQEEYNKPWPEGTATPKPAVLSRDVGNFPREGEN